MVRAHGRRAGASDFDSITTDNVWLGQVSSTPTDADIGSGNTAFYAKTDENVYKKPHGGTESQVGAGGATTKVIAHRATDSTGNTADSWTNIVDTEDKDVDDEFASNQFTPAETGEYHVRAYAKLVGSSGDDYQIQLRNATDTTQLFFTQHGDGGEDQGVFLDWTGDLQSGDSYEVRAKSRNSQYTVDSGTDRTQLVIVKT